MYPRQNQFYVFELSSEQSRLRRRRMQLRKPAIPEFGPNENITSFNRWTSVAGLDNFTDKQMWDLLIITGGNDMEDLIQFQSGIETRQQARVQAVIGPPAVPEIPQITPSTWEEGMTLARAAINRHTNQTEDRDATIKLHRLEEMGTGVGGTGKAL